MLARIVAAERETFRCAIGLPITPQASLAETPSTDIVIVTDLTLGPSGDPRGRWPVESRWLREQFENGATICSVCTGSVLLADTGLLDGHVATTHWSATELFRTRFPEVRLRPERIIVPSGPDHRLITCGGASSWEDLALYLIARFCGEAEAVRTAKIFVFGDRSEGQAAYAVMGQGRRHEDAVIAQCQVWIAEHYQSQNPVSRMVARSGLAERTFKRRFQAATGYSPVEYVQTLRVEEAKQLLESTNEPTDAIAHQVGYDDPASFRSLFKRKTGITPARYRQRFQSVVRLHQAG
jgi:transcriptional regulator GlxA family with amidase domain